MLVGVPAAVVVGVVVVEVVLVVVVVELFVVEAVWIPGVVMPGPRRENRVGGDSGRGERRRDVPHVRAAHLHHQHVDDHFGPCLVEIGDELLDQRHRVRLRPHDQRILRRKAEDLLHVDHGAQNGQHFLHLLRRRHVRQIENLHHLFGILAPLGRIIDRNENRVRRKRLPERFRQHRQLIQRLVERRTGQIDRLRPDRLLLIVFRIDRSD